MTSLLDPLRQPVDDAWRTIVPFRDERHGPLPPLLLALTVVTGLVDAFSYLVLGHVFVANMTGNVVFLAFALAGASGFSIPASLLALGAFFVGAGAGGRLGVGLGAHRGRLLTVATLVEAILVATAVALTAAVSDPTSGAARYVLIALLGLAMGIQNAAARRLAVPDLTTTVLTLTLTGMSADGLFGGGSNSKVGRRLLSVLAMFLGALGGSLLLLEVTDALSIGMALLVLCLTGIGAAALSRPDRPWVHAS